MILTQTGYDPGDDPPGVPLIGYDNKVTNAVASSEASGFPASNLLNSATHLKWHADDTDPQTIGLTTSGECDYLAVAGHNFGDAGISASITGSTNTDATLGFLTLLTHFEGTNGTAEYFDTSGNDHAFGQSGGGGLLSNAQFKFGATSVAFDGVNDFITTAGSIFAFGSSDFTVDLWVRITATGTQYTILDTGAATTGFSIRKNAANVLVFRTGNTDQITGASAFITGLWIHVALARSGGSTRLFADGLQQGSTFSDSTVYTAPTNPVRFGATGAGADFFSGWMDELRVLTGSGAYTGNFTVPSVAYVDGLSTVVGNYSALLHFDGVDASTTMTDSEGGHTFTRFGNAQLDTAQFKFGTASLLLASGDYIEADGSQDFAFGSGAFTIDFWVRLSASGTEQHFYDMRPLGSAGTGPFFFIRAEPGNTVIFWAVGATRITSSTVLALNQWYHIAVTRSGTSTRLFIDGVQEGSTYTDANEYTNDTTNRPTIGNNGAVSVPVTNGWLDEIRVIKGNALWTGRFVPPTRAAGAQAIVGKTASIGSTNLPLIFRFTPTSTSLQLRLSSASEELQAAVIYAGTLLVLERGVKADVGHVDITHARRSNVLAGMSESGNFLGRVLLGSWRESQSEFAWFTPDWYRENFEPFVISAVEEPFFYAWNPDEYPEETAFAWIIEDIQPETDPATRRMAATIVMRAIA